MVFEFTIFGIQLFSMSLFHVETVDESEYISNAGGDFERAVPFGFAQYDYDGEEEDE